MSVNVTSQPGNNGIKPEAPTGQSATATAGGGATVSFTPSTNPGKGTANYVATSSPGSFTASAASSPITFSSGTLTANTAYTFTIVKQSGSGISSNASSATGSITAFYVPGAPTSVSAAATGTSKQITVSWAAPSANGSAITGYYIDYSTSSTFASGVTTTTSASTSKTITDAGWTNGTTVYFRVRAENAAGQSSNSGTASDYPYAPPTFGTQSGSSTATEPTTTTTTSVSSVGTTTATLSYSLGTGATFSSYERISGTSVTPAGNSLSGLAENTNHQWRAVVTNSSSSQSLTARVTPNGSATTVSVEYGNTTSYGTSAGSQSYGASNSEQAYAFSLGSSGSSTIYYRITATYRGGATVQTTGSIARTVSTYNGSSTPVFQTMGTHTYTSFTKPTGITVKRRTYHNDISSISISLVGGGGGGSGGNGGYGTGGGGGGQVWSVSGYTSTGSMSITAAGAGGAAGGYGGTTYFLYYSYPDGSLTGVSVNAGTPGVQGSGGDSGSGNLGLKNGSTPYFGGGGGGQGGAANSTNGGAADANSWGGGGGGWGNAGFGDVNGSRTFGVGAGGNGVGGAVTDGSGVFGYWTITYTGPAAEDGYTGLLFQTYSP